MMQVNIKDEELDRKIAAWAVVSGKGLEGAVREIAGRFVKAAIRNTPPMIARSSPAQAKREWTARVVANYEKKPYVRGQWLSKAEMRRELAAKKRQLGREAAGWNQAAAELNIKPPAWVKRHSGEGACRIVAQGSSYSISVRNSVPYGQDLLQHRANFTLGTVKAGLNGSLRAMKQKLLRSIR